MKKTKFVIGTAFLASLFVLAGCAHKSMYPWGITETRNNLMDLEIGMTKQQVLELMGRPYAREVFSGPHGESCDFLIYITQYTHSGPIPDSDKTPVCLRDGKLVGWGRNFYDRTKRYDVRVHQDPAPQYIENPPAGLPSGVPVSGTGKSPRP